MNLLSLNLHSYQEKNAYAKLAMVADAIINQKIDVICLCECAQSILAKTIKGEIKANNAAYIIQQLIQERSGLHYELRYTTTHISYLGYEEGLAILSIYPVHCDFNFFISKQRHYLSNKSRKALQVILNIDEQQIAIYNAHFGFDTKNKFIDQFHRIHTYISFFNYPTIISGDFNIDSKSQEYYEMMQYGYQDCSSLNEQSKHEPTWFQGKAKGHLDYILTETKIRLLDYSSMFIHQRVSDHLGVCASLQL